MEGIVDIKGIECATIEEVKAVNELMPILQELKEKCEELNLGNTTLSYNGFLMRIEMFGNNENTDNFSILIGEVYKGSLYIGKKYFEEGKIAKEEGERW